MLIAEDLLLLLTDDDTGKLIIAPNAVDIALGGANLVELALRGRVDIAGADQAAKKGRLAIRNGRATGDALLDDALDYLKRHDGKKPSSVVGPLGWSLRINLYDRLMTRGMLRHEQGQILGLFPTHRWPSRDAAHERAVRTCIEGALIQRVPPDERTAALISLLHALKAVHKVMDAREHGVLKSDLKARAGRIADGDWSSKAARESVDATRATLVAATTAAATTAAISGGN